MIKRQLQKIADKHNVEYSEAKEIFKSIVRLTLMIVVVMISFFMLGYYLGTLNQVRI